MREHRYADVYAPLAQRITQARLAHGMTQADLGAAAGMSTTTITMIEIMRQSVAVHQLLAIARALDVDVCRLLGCSHTHDQETHQDDVRRAATVEARIDDLAARVRSLERALHRAGLRELS